MTTGGDHVTTGGDHVTPATFIQPSVQSMVEGVTVVPSTQMAPNSKGRSQRGGDRGVGEGMEERGR